MLFDLALLLVCIGSAAVLWYRVSQKIPELVAIPDEVIVDRLHEDSARIRVFLLTLRRSWRDGEHWLAILRYAERALYRTHILLMKADNWMMGVVKDIRLRLDGGQQELRREGMSVADVDTDIAADAPSVQSRGGTAVTGSIRSTSGNMSNGAVLSPPQPAVPPPASVLKQSRIQEVRRKGTRKINPMSLDKPA